MSALRQSLFAGGLILSIVVILLTASILQRALTKLSRTEFQPRDVTARHT